MSPRRPASSSLMDDRRRAALCAAVPLRRRFRRAAGVVASRCSLVGRACWSQVPCWCAALRGAAPAQHHPAAPPVLPRAGVRVSAGAPVCRTSPTGPTPCSGSWLALLRRLLWALFVRARRQLVAVAARSGPTGPRPSSSCAVDQARQLERTRIAREMHDVLAHRISLLSLHAGALEFRPDAPPEEVARAAGVIRASAHGALQDLREVIGVLRADAATATARSAPQPTPGRRARAGRGVPRRRDAGRRWSTRRRPADVPDGARPHARTGSCRRG